MAFEVKAQRAQEDEIMRYPFSALRQSMIEDVRNAVDALRSERPREYEAWYDGEAKRAAEEERKFKQARQAAKLAEQRLSKGQLSKGPLQKPVNH